MAAGQEEKWAELLWAAMSEVAGLRKPGGGLELAEPGDELGREVAERLREWLQSAGKQADVTELAEAGRAKMWLTGEVPEEENAVSEGQSAVDAAGVAKTFDLAGEAGVAVAKRTEAAEAAEDVRLRRVGGAADEMTAGAAKMRGVAAGEGYAGRGEGYAAGYAAGNVFAAGRQAGLAAEAVAYAGGQEVARRGEAGLSEAEMERICGLVLERLCAGIDVYLQSSAVR